MTAGLLVGLLAVVSSLDVSAQNVTIVNTNVARLEEGEILPNRTVVVADGRIVSLDPHEGDVAAPEGAWIDGEGLYLVPGRVELGVRVTAEDSLDWREEMLVRLARGVTTLGVAGFDAQALDSVRTLVPAGYPAPGLVASNGGDPGSSASASSPGIEVGAPADLLLLEDDPLGDPTALRRPIAIMVAGRVYPRANLAAIALELGHERRYWPYQRAPITRANFDGAWPRSCVGESLEECFGGDPECALIHVLYFHDRRERDCTAASVREGRGTALRALDRLATVAPSDAWLVGQRVYLALLDHELDRAWDAAEGCASERWWCQALRGLVLHKREPGSAGTVFDSAYVSAPADTPAWGRPRIPDAGDRGVRCEWSDVSYLIEDPELFRDYAAAPCGSRSEFETRFWWLGDPLWSRPGNARRDEHIARNVLARLRDDVLRSRPPRGRLINHAHCTVLLEYETYRGNPNRAACWSSHEDFVAFGPPNSWRGVPYETELGFLIGANGILQNPEPGSRCRTIKRSSSCTTWRHAQLREGFLNGGYSFVPGASSYFAPEASTADDWALTWNEGHERMLTRETWYNLDHQTAVLRRGDELRILAAARFPALLPSLDSLAGFLAVGRPRDQHVEVTPAEVGRVDGVMRVGVTLPEDEWIVSVEALAPELRGRARLGAPPPPLVEGFGISRPVLMPADFDPDEDDLLASMLPSTTIPGGGVVGLYVELYGVEAGETAEMALTYDPGEEEPSFFGRIGSIFGLGGDDGGPVRVEWTVQIEEVEDDVARVFVASELGDFGDAEILLTMTASVEGRTATASTTLKPRR